MNGHWLNSVKSHLLKGIKLRNQQIDEHNKLVDSGEIKNYRWRHKVVSPNSKTWQGCAAVFESFSIRSIKRQARFEAEDRLDEVRWEVGVYTRDHSSKYDASRKRWFFYKGERNQLITKFYPLLTRYHITHNFLTAFAQGYR